MAKVAFLVTSADCLKLYGPLVEQGLRSNEFDSVLFCFTGDVVDLRLIAPRLFEVSAAEKLGVVKARNDQELIDVLTQNAPALLFTVGPIRTFSESRAHTRKLGVRWCALPYIYEELWQLLSQSSESSSTWDWIGITSDQGIRFLPKYFGPPHDNKGPHFEVVGNLTLDQFHYLRDTNPYAELGLANDQPLAVTSTYVAPQVPSWSAIQRQIVKYSFTGRDPWRQVSAFGSQFFPNSIRTPKLGYRTILNELQAFSKRNGLKLVAKTRPKHQDRPSDLERFEHVFSHSQFYPFTTVQLMRCAKVYCGFASAMAFEARASDCLGINLFPFELGELNHLRKAPGHEAGLWDTVFLNPGGLYAPGNQFFSLSLCKEPDVLQFLDLMHHSLETLRKDSLTASNSSTQSVILGLDAHETASNKVLRSLKMRGWI